MKDITPKLEIAEQEGDGRKIVWRVVEEAGWKVRFDRGVGKYHAFFPVVVVERKGM